MPVFVANAGRSDAVPASLAVLTTKTPAMGPRFLFNVGGDRGAGGMLAVQSIEETAFEDFGSAERR